MIKMNAFPKNHAGALLVEVLISMALAAVIAGIGYSFLRSASVLFSKNMSIVHSHTGLRSALDRLSNNIQQTNSLPVLINANGSPSTAPAAGLFYDRFLGAPYVITNSSGTGLSASTTTLTLTRPTAALASPPVPVAGDALLIDDPNGTVRALVSSSTAGPANASLLQTITLTLSAPLGKAVIWSAPEIRTAKLVHREAFLVVPTGNKAELRFFKNFEPVPNLTQPASYSVVSNQLSSAPGETTPFSIDTIGADKIVRANLCARSPDYNLWLSNKEGNNLNTYVRLNASLGPRLRPRQ
jgi:hypothetical protein